jgi:imidazolonepropionase-like amidohydrolase
MQSIVAGTSAAAKLLGMENRIGTLAAGKMADVVAVRGNPLQDVRALETGVVFVMKDGIVHRQP